MKVAVLTIDICELPKELLISCVFIASKTDIKAEIL